MHSPFENMAKKEYTYEEMCRNIVAKKFAPVYIMMGDEPFFMDQITDLLLENVLEESERDFNQIIMYLSLIHISEPRD